MAALIVSASRRTDIPAFYAEWLMLRVQAGFCRVPNPFRPSLVTRVDLRPEAVAGFVFWTRDPAPLLPRLQELDRRGYGYYFLYSILGYPGRLEPRSPPVGRAVATFGELSRRLGRARVVWRYDPLVLDAELTPEWHHRNFTRLLERLAPHTDTVIVSVVDPYRKTRRGIGHQGDVDYEPESYRELLVRMATASRAAGVALQSCAEATLGGIAGLAPGPCVDADRLQRAGGRRAAYELRPTRPGCRCHRSVDIGINNTCGFGCRYCYATRSADVALAAARSHDPTAESLA